MHHFDYRDDELFCEDVAVAKIAAEVGTPFFLYSHATLIRHYQAFDQAFGNAERLVCYSAKANASLAILSLFAEQGSGLDIVSGGELYKGLKAGFKPDRIVYSGVGKRVDEIDYALQSGILMFNIESLEELALIDARAGALGRKAPIAIRVNPDVDPKTHPYISTGLDKNKFGIGTEAALEGYKLASRLEHIEIVGIDCHIGSQITETQPFEDALKSVVELNRALGELGITIQYLDMGGGLGITYDNEVPPKPVEYANSIIKVIGGLPVKIILEPGRVLVGNAGILISRVLYRKAGKTKKFVIVDAGMNDLLRPSIYKAYHGILPLNRSNDAMTTADVVGPICESGDFLAQDRHMPDFKAGDLLAVMSAGAYGFSMSSNYCSRLKVAEVMVKDDRFELIRARQTYEDLITGEKIPGFL